MPTDRQPWQAAPPEEVDAELEALALEEGLLNPEWLPRLIDRAAIRYGPDGRPTNLRPLVVEFRRAHPELLDVTSGGEPIERYSEPGGDDGLEGRRARTAGARAAAAKRRQATSNERMNSAMRALLEPAGEDDPNVVRLARTIVTPEAPAAADPAAMNEALRVVVRGPRRE